MSDAGSGFSGCALACVLTDRLRERPLPVLVVAVDDCEAERDMLVCSVHAWALLVAMQQLLPGIGRSRRGCGVFVVFAKALFRGAIASSLPSAEGLLFVWSRSGMAVVRTSFFA
jgi:hypothetical protein